MEQKIYNQLLEQYNVLTEEEKRAILIYKSFLFYHINKITNISNFEQLTENEILSKLENKEEFISQFEKFKSILKQPQNLTVKFTIFHKINFDTIETFIKSLIETYKILNTAKQKISLNSTMTVYRGVSSTHPIKNISKSSIISTSIKVEDADKFLFTSKNNQYNTLFVLQLDSAINVLISPYTIVQDYHNFSNFYHDESEKATIKIVNSTEQNQQEIILFKEDLEYEFSNTKQLTLDNNQVLTIQYVNVKQKNQIKQK